MASYDGENDVSNVPDASDPGASVGKQIQSPKPPPGVHFDSQHRKVWDYLCAALRDEGVPHRTAGVTLAIVCTDFVRWVKTEVQLRDYERINNGSFMTTTPNGHTQPHQLYYAAKALKEGLLKCLPEACLTLPSMLIAKSKMQDENPQDDLFDQLTGHAQSHPSALHV
ncbi:P27 family phage terminase small subunit [Burkholderia sp. MBR-1]|uniref:P27 family phage terminase small subunit n=1 Tax=Burkholderia sp. MBR-1 TaxID=2732364 RepID=UPI00215D8F29|nr:P27 family phage terminase small subunit [Burkholderia sp. MBR-1]